MGSATLTGLLAMAAILLLGLGRALSNADFIYTCAAADVLAGGVMPVTQYFPPGYPALIWLALKCGMSALTGGMLLSALGAGLAAGSLTFMARRWGLPPAAALCLGLLGLSLPSMFEICLNPQLDALYTGLSLALICIGVSACEKPPHPAVMALAALISMLLLTLRWHAVIVVLPLALLMVFGREKRRRALGLLLLSCSLPLLLWLFWSLYITQGSLQLAVGKQLAVGHELRSADDSEAASHMVFDDYEAWLAERQFEPQMAIEGISSNYLHYISRRAILLGALLCLLGAVFARRLPPAAAVLGCFILYYCAITSTAYFVPRASALPELCGLLLAASGLSLLFNWQGRRDQRRLVNIKLDSALAGMILSLLLLAAVGYNAWRESALLSEWGRRRALLNRVNEIALDAAGGERLALCGPLDLCGWTHSAPGNLPAATFSRLWIDDPEVWPMLYRQLPRWQPHDVITGRTEVSAVLLWPGLGHPLDIELNSMFAADVNWRVQESGAPEARLFVWDPRPPARLKEQAPPGAKEPPSEEREPLPPSPGAARPAG